MNKRILQKNQEGGFYLPGEEVSVKSDDMFLRWDTQDGVNIRKKRLFFCIFCCSVAYMLVGFRLFGAGVLPNLQNYDEDRKENVQKKSVIHRADILDRNGTILAASIPIKNLNVSTRNILSPRQTAENLVNIFPELKFEEIKTKNFQNVMNNLNVNTGLVVLAENDEKVVRSFSNIAGVMTAQTNTINVYDILNHDTLIVASGAVEKIEEVYA